jgi:hypothetical protein
MKITQRLLLACFIFGLMEATAVAASFNFGGTATEKGPSGPAIKTSQAYSIVPSLTVPKTIRVTYKGAKGKTLSEIYSFGGSGRLVHKYLTDGSVQATQKGTYTLKNSGATTVIGTRIVDRYLGGSVIVYTGTFTISEKLLKVKVVENNSGKITTLTFSGVPILTRR